MTRLLALSSAFVVPENRAVFTSLADDFGFDVTLVSPCSWTQRRYGATQTFQVVPEERPGYRVVPLPFSEGRFERYHDLMPELRRARPAIVVCAHEFNSFATIHSLLLARSTVRRPLTVSCSLQNIPCSTPKIRHYVRERAAFALSDVILASCVEAAAVLRNRRYKGRIAVTYPLGSATVTPPEETTARTENTPFTIGFVGRIASEKGVFTLAEACGRMRGDVQMLFVGDGPDRSLLQRRLGELGLEQRSRFVGLIDRDKISRYYAEMDVLVLPSLSTPGWKEQFGVVLAEAMLMGVAVVGSTSGAIPEVIGDAGLTFAEGDANALQACLQSLHDSPEICRDLARRGISRAQEHFTPRALARQLVDIFSAMGGA
jgi:glycosyltransferase involved in cell wall biosynthesis